MDRNVARNIKTDILNSLNRIARRDFPFNGKDYQGDVLKYMAKAYRQLFLERFYENLQEIF